MFTGLVTDIGRLERTRAVGKGLVLTVVHDLGGGELERGESVAVDGCCLTVTDTGRGTFAADLSAETLARSGGRARWRTGRRVNLERALAAGQRLGGYYVQGHVDGVAQLVSLAREAGGWAVARVRAPREGRRWIIEKGSVALDGISLTVARCTGDWFEVAVIPETMRSSTLHLRRPGDRLTIEYDILARYAAGAAGHHAEG